MMARSIAHVTLVVRDYDEVISYFTDGLRFTLVEETPLGADERWVVVAPPESQGASLLFAEAATLEQSLQFGIT